MEKVEYALQSMTGFGQAEGMVEGHRVHIDIKSVNHRYAEVSVKLPREWAYLEEPVRKAVLSCMKRGRIEVYVTIDRGLDGAEARKLVVDWALVKQYVDAARQLQEEAGIEGALNVQELLNNPELVRYEKQAAADVETFQQSFILLLEEALQQLLTMRLKEGSNLHRDIVSRMETFQQHLRAMQEKSAEAVIIIRDRLRQRIRELLDGIVELDEQRIVTEAAVYADKADIAEEITRLKSHLQQWDLLLKTEEPVGRKLDFLVQEIHRELNTIGSKTVQTEIVTYVIEMKSELERVREQVQNIQ